MNTYKCLVKVEVTKVIKTTKDVVIQANDAHKAKLQLEAMYGKTNLISSPILVSSKC
jgi:hypothetical protein